MLTQKIQDSIIAKILLINENRKKKAKAIGEWYHSDAFPFILATMAMIIKYKQKQVIKIKANKKVLINCHKTLLWVNVSLL
ncbi:hypothetical protein UUR10_0031 [Ureaplasma urealyticum serovar 10 str. ATCC 33699]|uniref:Uncharacterized protein n=1 Tax=Ureaplasma urealyticum serovar 10 (strain ATCC 33699 / Western) TaxID=565575 RepID=B5ZAK5_UREU1|nr:hypothetical protein UUR10_0031 [Ureaplasma urealyticum serovar 10 str. ATCC 33699]